MRTMPRPVAVFVGVVVLTNNLEQRQAELDTAGSLPEGAGRQVASQLISDYPGTYANIVAAIALFAAFVRDMAVEAAIENAEERRRRGERMGRIPYGDRPGDQPDKVIATSACSSQRGGSRLPRSFHAPSHDTSNISRPTPTMRRKP